MGKKSAQIRNKGTSSPTANSNEAEVRIFASSQPSLECFPSPRQLRSLLVTFSLAARISKGSFLKQSRNNSLLLYILTPSRYNR